MYKVYMHIFPNGKKYIGITMQELKARFDNGNGYKNNPMKRAIKKYGWENIKHDLLFDNLTKDQAELKEIELISFYNTTNINYGYNLSKGGKGSNGCKFSEKTKQKMSSWHKGKTLSKETKEKIGIGHRKDLSGKRFGRLVAISPTHKNNRVAWNCICDCGNYKVVNSCPLVDGRTLSCGCLARDKIIKRNKSKKQRELVRKMMIGNKRRAKV